MVLGWLAACGAPAPRQTPVRAEGGGDGARVVLRGAVEAVIPIRGETAAELAAELQYPDRSGCPGNAMRWRRKQERYVLEACAPPPEGTRWGDVAVRTVAVSLGDGALWVTLALDGAPGTVVAEAPFDRHVGASGAHATAVDWKCRTCGPDGGAAVLGTGEVEVSWALDPKVGRDWVHYSRAR